MLEAVVEGLDLMDLEELADQVAAETAVVEVEVMEQTVLQALDLEAVVVVLLEGGVALEVQAL
jgi:hypothetical protein